MPSFGNLTNHHLLSLHYQEEKKLLNDSDLSPSELLHLEEVFVQQVMSMVDCLDLYSRQSQVYLLETEIIDKYIFNFYIYLFFFTSFFVVSV